MILHVLPYVRDVGDGIVNGTVDLACEQQRLGHQVTVASSGGEFEELLADHHVGHRHLTVTRKPSRLARAKRELDSAIDGVRPDMVHAHTLTSVVTVRGGRPMKRLPLVTTAHTEFYRSTPMLAVADRVIAPSDAVARALRRRGLPGRKVRVVPAGGGSTPDGARAQARGRSSPADLERPSVVTVGAMRKRKGIDDLIGAFATAAKRMPDSNAHLYLVGEGPDKPEFEMQAQQTGLGDRIHFTGYQSDPGRYLRSADIFVLASRRDPAPLVIGEARGAGCAIVASDADGIPELLEGGRAGRLFPTGDRATLASEIERLLSDDQYRHRWQVAALENMEWLRAERVARDIVSVYEELLTARTTAARPPRLGPSH